MCVFVLQEDIAKLLRFESSALAPGELTSLDEYASRMKAGARTIHYFAAPRYSALLSMIQIFLFKII